MGSKLIIGILCLLYLIINMIGFNPLGLSPSHLEASTIVAGLSPLATCVAVMWKG